MTATEAILVTEARARPATAWRVLSAAVRGASFHRSSARPPAAVTSPSSGTTTPVSGWPEQFLDLYLPAPAVEVPFQFLMWLVPAVEKFEKDRATEVRPGKSSPACAADTGCGDNTVAPIGRPGALHRGRRF